MRTRSIESALHSSCRPGDARVCSTGRLAARPLGLTLVELLVTIVIMVTVLAGVIPMMSPNDNGRKIREAARQVSGMLAQAQAQAARDGRPAGVAFRESVVGSDPSNPTGGSGMALEAFMVAVPKPFPGFSEWSRAHVDTNTGRVYGNAAGGNGGTKFPRYNGEPIVELRFTVAPADPNLGDTDLIPPGTFTFGDVIQMGDHKFLIVDDDTLDDVPNAADPDGATPMLLETNVLDCVWMNRTSGQLPPIALKPYLIRQQPTSTAAPPVQFPRAIGIDLQGSGTNLGGDFDAGNIRDLVSIMFSPTGSVSVVLQNGTKFESMERIFILLGVAANGNPESADYDFKNFAADDEQLEERRRRVNWLHPDAQWVTVSAQSGRIVTSNNNVSFDPRVEPFTDVSGTAQEQVREQRNRQRQFARDNARQSTSAGGR